MPGKRRRGGGIAAVAILLAALAAPVPAAAVEIDCHAARDASCGKIGPHALPLSVPEFNRLALRLQGQPETAASLILFGLLNADERPPLASELVLARMTETAKAHREAVATLIREDPAKTAKCAASFVDGTSPPYGRFDSNAIVFWSRPGLPSGKAKTGRRQVRLCSGAFGCVQLTLVPDTDRGWLASDLTPLIDACRRLK